MDVLRLILAFLRVLFGCWAPLAAENMALRQQVAVYRQSVKRPKLRPRDRVFWVLLSRLWPNWRPTETASSIRRSDKMAVRCSLAGQPQESCLASILPG